MSDIKTAVVDSLKVLDPKRPIREADIPEAGRLAATLKEVGYDSTSGVMNGA